MAFPTEKFQIEGRHFVDIVVRSRPGHRTAGILALKNRSVPCALGRGGINWRKCEGDGQTPAGRFRLLGVYYRPDRVLRPRTVLPVRALLPDDGWCDDPADGKYNKAVKLPCNASCENMWRADHLYDYVVVLDHNTGPVKRFGGSAIFFHVASPAIAPTEGCVAVQSEVMRRILAEIGPDTHMRIAP